MSVTSSASALTNAWGIDLKYEDALGTWHETPEETIRAVLKAMDADSDRQAESPSGYQAG
jgi:hypothetical protein